MKEERLKVLEILQAGKINAEDASRLLEALNKQPAGEDDAVKVKVKVKTHHDEAGGGIEEEIDEEVDEGIKMKIKVKTHHDEDV
ncbi:MAG: hypothetical protein HN521_14020 [Candidatus Latescibacteria bacterium]|jgi:hypothetical protein|nr:hypothetical protein [Candidatus Latescibacterota bacterium]MBT5831811.1 hypothetical protein [Candidatus Latescibacterota bacterium]